MAISIRALDSADDIPYELLLLADPALDNVKDYLRRGQCFIAICQEEVVGVYVNLRTRPETIEIVNVAVREDMQGKGIGKQLVLSAIEMARLERVKTIEIGTGNSGVVQLALYQKCGFRMVSIDHDFFVRHYAEAIYENGIQCRDMVRLRMDLDHAWYPG